MFIIKIIFISILIKFLTAKETVRRSDVAKPSSSSTTANTLPGQQREDFVIELNIQGPRGGGRAGREGGNVGGTQTGQQGLQQQERQEGDHLNTTVSIQHIRPRREPCCVIL